MNRLVLVFLLAAAVFLFFLFDLDSRLSFAALQESLGALQELRQKSPLATAAAFVLVYILVAALSLPGAALMTLAAGALFGLLLGTVYASFASSVGALLAFLGSRYLLRESVQRRFGARLQAINSGIEREGLFYLFTLRLVPIFPFFLVNLLLGLTPMRASSFYMVSQVGMLAGTVVFVNAGTQLASLRSTDGLFTPAMLGAFALLGVLPLVARRFVDVWRRRRVYARWTRPRKFDRNLVVIGAGAAGLVTAYIAAAVKAKVTLIESHRMGGDCLNYGCVPSKALLRSAKLAHQMRHADHYGLTSTAPGFSFRRVMARVHEVIRSVAPHDSVERYTELGVEVLAGHARMLNPWTVEVRREGAPPLTLTTRSIVIATGARPAVPPLPGLENSGYVTSDTLWQEFAKLDAAPRRVVVLGGGPIGSELSQALARLGSAVTQVEMLPRLLIREDPEVSQFVQQTLAADGVTVLTSCKALACEYDNAEKFLLVEREGRTEKLPFDALVCAIGRVPRIEGFGLEELGVPTRRVVATNEYLETLYPNVFAAGDVAGPYQFTHTAAHQAWYAAVNALFGRFRKFKVDNRVIPATTFVDPEVARVGLNEIEAKEQGVPYEVTHYDLDDLDRAIADSATRGFVKVLTVPGRDRILGATIVGEHAGEILAEFVLAMKWNLGLNRILSTIHTYPTFAEANKYAAGVWKRAHVPQRLIPWLARFHAWQRGG